MNIWNTSSNIMSRKLFYIVNADWYFSLHWMQRAETAKKSGLNVAVVMPITDPAIKECIEQKGIRVIPWNITRSHRNVIQESYSIVQLGKILSRERPDLVHCITVKPNIYAFIISLFLELKLVISVTGLGMLFTSQRLFDRASGWIVKAIYSIASRKHYIFFENNDDLGIIKDSRFSYADNLKRVMGAGVSSNDYAYHDPLKIQGSLYLLFAARLLQPKGLDVLVEAVRRLNDQGYDVRLWVAGISDPDSPLAISQRRIDEWSKESFFNFLGNRKDVPDLIVQSHFVCLPTTYGEGIPRILIEAAAIGRPLITTNVPGCREICNDGFNGFLVPPGESQPIVDALKVIFSEPQKLESMSHNSKQVFDRGGYDSEQVIKYTLSVYSELLGQGASHR